MITAEPERRNKHDLVRRNFGKNMITDANNLAEYDDQIGPAIADKFYDP